MKICVKYVLGLVLVFALCAGLAGCSSSFWNLASSGTAKEHFNKFLDQCGTNEIRCLWFLRDDPRTGMRMTIQLKGKNTSTSMDVFELSEQEHTSRTLDDYQIAKLEDLSKHLPPSDKHSSYNSSIFVSVREEGPKTIFQYDRHHLPMPVRQLYAISGGFIYSEEQN
jgi:hypothetical protein